MHGDVAWGGNWFYLVHDHGLPVDAGEPRAAHRLRLEDPPGLAAARHHRGRRRRRSTTSNFSARRNIAEADSKNFVLCPGRAYDRSPCGTGTSAKLACLVADGKLKPGQVWRQESIVGSIFEGSVEIREGRVYPRIRGSAYITGEATLVLDPRDPFVHGIPSILP